MGRLPFAVAAAIAWLAIVDAAAFAAPAKIVLATAGADDPFAARLATELSDAGFEVSASADAATVSIEALGRAENADAVVRTLPSRRGVEVWLSERANGRPMIRHQVVDERPDGPDVALVALQTTELLRTGLLFSPPTTPPATPPPAAPRRHAVGVRAGPGFVAPRGGLGAQAGAWLSASVDVARRTALELFVSLPLTAMAVEGREGRADVRLVFGGAGIAERIGPVEVAIGLGAMRVGVAASAELPLVAAERSLVAPAAYARVGLHAHLRPWLRLGADVLALASTTRAPIVLAGREAAAFDHLALAVFTTVEARF